MTLPISKQSCRLLIFACATLLVVGLFVDQAFAGRSGDRRRSAGGGRSKSVSRRSDSRGSGSRYTSAYSGTSGGGTSGRHSRGRSPGRNSGSKPRHKSKSIGAKMGRIADKMAVGLSLYSSASIKYIEEYSLGKVHEYVLKAAKYRVERYAMIDDIGYDDDEILYYKEEWATRVAEVALGFHRMITTIYKAISGKKDEHADNVRHIKGELVKQRSMNDRADPGTKAAYNFERGQEEYVKEALSTMKNDLKYITEAENINNHMDLLTMFYKFYNRSNDYYKDYFKQNLMEEVYEILEDAMGQIDSGKAAFLLLPPSFSPS